MIDTEHVKCDTCTAPEPMELDASDEASRKFHPYFRSHSQLAVYSSGNAGSPNDDFSSLENSSQTPV